MQIEDLDKKVNAIHTLISANVKRLRKEKGFSQLQLASDIGFNGNAFLARAESRKNNAHYNIEYLIKIAAILDVCIEDFLSSQ